MDDSLPMKVFLLWHSYESEYDDCDHSFFLGVYSTRAKAEERQREAVRQPGFRLHPDGFDISEQTVDRDEWKEGFVTYLHEAGEDVPDPDPE